MIGIDDARAIVRAAAEQTRIVMRPLERCVAHVLAEDIAAREDIPLFDATAMDGYAVRSRDLAALPAVLPVAGVMQPGDAPAQRLAPGTAMRILTGAAIPPGADAVVMQEHVERRNGEIVCAQPVHAGAHIRRKGEEFIAGTRVLARGTPLTPSVIGLLAALGYGRVRVHAHPRIVVLVTGNELRKPGDRLAPGQIRDVNSFTIRAALARMGMEAEFRHVPDDRTQIDIAIREALRRCDLLLTTGGVSVGDHDHVRAAMKEAGVREHFWRVAMKPGKPVFFGTRGRRLAFGLPGNPLSALLALYLFVRPAIGATIGGPDPAPRRFRARLAVALQKQPGREHLLLMAPAQERSADGSARAGWSLAGGRTGWSTAVGTHGLPRLAPLGGQGSHMLGAAARGVLLYRFPEGASTRAAGSLIDVEELRWELW